jgi:RNA ligase (TIGR02306 family)
MPNWNTMKTDNSDLVFVGKIVDLQPISNADFIVSATVICGSGGRWKGIVRKSDFSLQDKCLVYLPDSLIPESAEMQFMKDSNWRVKMRRFKGVPSEVVIMPICDDLSTWGIGQDVTKLLGVTKYHKPISPHLQGIAKGPFPSLIPKIDEDNYQRCPELVDQLVGKHYYITEKMDGSSTTAFRYKDEFGVCSRNLELIRNPNNGYWAVAIKYKLEERLPKDIAIQWETCGPGIQCNPSGLKELDGFVFSAYNMFEHRYLEMTELWSLIDYLKMPTCKVLHVGSSFNKEGIELLGEGNYEVGRPREGVVVRSQENCNGKPISFKVINLNYEK